MLKKLIFIFILVVFVYVPEIYGNEAISIILNGKEVDYSISPVIRDDVLYVPVDDRGTQKLIDYFGAQLILKPDEVYINKMGKASRFKINQEGALVSGKPGITKNPPFIKEDITYIAFDDLTRVLYVRYKAGEEKNEFLLFPEIYQVDLTELADGEIEILFQATSKINCNTSYMSEGYGFVVEIPDCFIDLDKDLLFNEYDIIKYISIVQLDVDNPLVRMEIKLTRPVHIDISSRVDLSMLPVRIDPSGKQVTEEWLPAVSPGLIEETINLRTQLIKNVSFYGDSDKKIIKINTTGLVKYQWKRLWGIDNRFYIDLSKSIFARNNIISVNDDVISDIRLAKVSTDPEIVRVIFEIKEDLDFQVYPSEEIANELIIEIDNKHYSTGETLFSGEGVFGNMYSDKTVVIDPGHGGGDPGAIQFGMREKDLNLDIALRLEELLLAAGYNVILTRNTDTDVTWLGSPDKLELQARADVANSLEADVFISIHNDSSTNTSMHGTCTFYYKAIDYELGRIIQKHMAAELGIANRGVKQAEFYVLSHTEMPAVLVEVAFMSHKDNAMLLAEPEFRQKAAEAICDALIEYSDSFQP